MRKQNSCFVIFYLLFFFIFPGSIILKRSSIHLNVIINMFCSCKSGPIFYFMKWSSYNDDLLSTYKCAIPNLPSFQRLENKPKTSKQTACNWTICLQSSHFVKWNAATVSIIFSFQDIFRASCMWLLQSFWAHNY